MLRLLNAALILVVVFNSANGDCGCNRLNRAPPPPVVDTLDDNLVAPAGSCSITEDGSEVCSDTGEAEVPDDNTFKRAINNAIMAAIPGGDSIPIGTDKPFFPQDGEGPVHKEVVNNFYLDKYAVSNSDFALFVSESNYKTEAEVFGDSFVFRDEISEEVQQEYVDFRVVGAEWWYKVKNVTWRQPEGEGSDLNGRYIYFFFYEKLFILFLTN